MTNISPSEALTLLRKQPYDITPALAAIKDVADLTDPALPQLCARVAAAMPSQQAYEDLLGDRARVLDNFYPTPEETTPSTEDTIDTFLSTFGAADSRETDALSRLIFSSTPDYEATLAAEQRATPLPEAGEESTEQERLINSFLRKEADTLSAVPPKSLDPSAKTKAESEEVAPKSEELTNARTPGPASPRSVEEASLTESFVKILIKNRNYTKALEIISEINLKNPKKSIYFADQIRFLKKLIINENKK